MEFTHKHIHSVTSYSIFILHVYIIGKAQQDPFLSKVKYLTNQIRNAEQMENLICSLSFMLHNKILMEDAGDFILNKL